jgi:hypothetical protein
MPHVCWLSHGERISLGSSNFAGNPRAIRQTLLYQPGIRFVAEEVGIEIVYSTQLAVTRLRQFFLTSVKNLSRGSEITLGIARDLLDSSGNHGLCDQNWSKFMISRFVVHLGSRNRRINISPMRSDDQAIKSVCVLSNYNTAISINIYDSTIIQYISVRILMFLGQYPQQVSILYRLIEIFVIDRLITKNLHSIFCSQSPPTIRNHMQISSSSSILSCSIS